MTQLVALETPVRPAQRYIPAKLSGVLHWGIYDTHMGAWCSLAVGPGCFAPLEWKTREEAQHWLYVCRVVWASRLVPAPEGWNG